MYPSHQLRFEWLDRLCRQGHVKIYAQPLRLMLLMLTGLLLIGLAGNPVANFIVDKKQPRNIVEWNFALLIISYYIVVWRA
jgi:hypothetical protein